MTSLKAVGNPSQRQKTGRAQIWVKEPLLFHLKYEAELDLLTDPHQAESNPNAGKGFVAQSGTSSEQTSKLNSLLCLLTAAGAQ